MSRYIGDKESSVTLEASEHWRQQGLLTEGSIFADKSLWRLEHFQALNEHFVNQPLEGEGSFFEKLSAQLVNTAPEVKQLAAEILWVMFLCPSNIGEDKKREGIQTIWGWAEESFIEDSPWLRDDYLGGVGSAGTGFNTNRAREYVFVIRIVMNLKQLVPSNREALLNDGWKLAEWLEQIPECDARQFRHMMLFLLFPDSFERIFGGTDRRKIVTAFSRKSEAQVNAMSAIEIDKELHAIRKNQEDAFGMKDLDFYETPLRELWKDAGNAAWLLTWNPEKWNWDSLKADRAATHKGETVTHRWACANRKAAVGDKVYLARTGVSPKGVVAVGNIVTGSYEAPHWEEAKAENGQTCWYVDVAFSRIQDPLAGDPYLSMEDLKKITVDQQHWTPEYSGIEIKTRSAGILKKRWEEVVVPVGPTAAVATNLIFYGPPGTGKTHYLNNLIERYRSRKQKIGREAWLIQQLLDMRWFDAVFAALWVLGGRARAKDIVNHEYIVLKARAMGRNRHVTNTVWATLQAHTVESSQTVQYKNKSLPYVFDKQEDGHWHLVEDWKEECAEQVSMAQALQKGPVEEAAHQRYEFITFHQAYSYEDFVEGIRPIYNDETGEIEYRVVPGVFTRIAQKAKADPGQRYAIFIDEINRGNIAKIFGELITLIETDKRIDYDENGGKGLGMTLTLPYSGEAFGVPANLDLYGTMNTADRSIALMDTALRRRFTFRELMPDPGFISGSRGDGYIEDGEGGSINLRALLEAINQRIRFLLNRDMMLGHAYFIKITDFSGLKHVLLNQIIPLLQEYFYEDWHRIQLVFRDVGPDRENIEPQIICHRTLKEEEILGFDHDDYDDLIDYWVAAANEITPDAIRKVYEEPA
jgi:5-methylcytosine-specific restriction enzyme B